LGGVFQRLGSAGFHVLFLPASVDRHHDLCVKAIVADGVVAEVCVKLAIPAPILHMLRDARFGRVFENVPILVLEVDHVDQRVELIPQQGVARRLPPLAIFLTVTVRGFLPRGRPLAQLGPLHPLQSQDLYHCHCYRGRGFGYLLVAFQYPEYPI
ncbi:hypothetical protein PanWU01x14_185160, partial [Parasponia andersonii]